MTSKPQDYEIRPDVHALASNSAGEVDYEPQPERSKPLSPDQDKIVKAITSLYSGSASKDDMLVYAEKSVYDDPLSYCDDRYKIAGQWYGIPKLFATSKTLKTEVVSATPTEIIFKLQQEYTPKILPGSKVVNSLVTLSLDEQGMIKYHKDMWGEKDYSHQGIGKFFKDLNGDHLTKITEPPVDL